MKTRHYNRHNRIKTGILSLFLGGLIMSGLMGAGGQAQAARMDGFDDAALRRLFAQPCHAQQETRMQNVLPSYFKGTAPLFKNESGAYAVFSPALTRAQRRLSDELMASIPPHVRAFGFLNGAYYIFSRRGVVEAIPALSQEAGYYGDSGLYMAVQRTIFMPFEKGEVFTASDGTLRARVWHPSQREPFRIVNHESGHMIDDLLGDYSANSKGPDNDHRLTNRRDFMQAVERDLRRLASAQRPVTMSEIGRLGYYMPDQFGGVNFGGIRKDAQRLRREIFAELWAEAQGYHSNRLSRAYPDTFVVVRAMDTYLRALHDAAPLRCVYDADGSAAGFENRGPLTE